MFFEYTGRFRALFNIFIIVFHIFTIKNLLLLLASISAEAEKLLLLYIDWLWRRLQRERPGIALSAMLTNHDHYK